MADSTDIVVICGGKGSRIRPLSDQYQCKSLIPILGRPAIEYVLRALRETTGGRIILCVDRRSLSSPLQDIVDHLQAQDVQFYTDNGRGPMPAMYEASAFCKGERVLVLFGHHLVTPTHLAKLLSVNPGDTAVSLFQTSSESHCKITALRPDGTCAYASRYTDLVPLQAGQFYIDLPYVLPARFFLDSEYATLKRWFIKGSMQPSDIPEDERTYGIEADFPHEFHWFSDIPEVERFAQKLRAEHPGASWIS